MTSYLSEYYRRTESPAKALTWGEEAYLTPAAGNYLSCDCMNVLTRICQMDSRQSCTSCQTSQQLPVPRYLPCCLARSE